MLEEVSRWLEAEDRLDTGYRLELEAYYRLLDTEDRREGIAAFNEKRKADFKGR